MKKYSGLTDAEAKKSAEQFGTNALSEHKRETFWQKYFKSFNDPIITILLIALGINLLFTFIGKIDWFECAGILLSILIATFVSTLSEYKSESKFRRLSDKASDTYEKVFRNGELISLATKDIVCGDFILLQPGDIVPADGKLAGGSIKVDQSPLNGENKEVKKNASAKKGGETPGIDFWDLTSVFRGSVITHGEGVMIAEKIGDSTLYGKINSEKETAQAESPLTEKLRKVAKSISIFGYIGAALTFLIIMLQKSVFSFGFNLSETANYFLNFGQVMADLSEALIMSVVVIVVAVPEGLPLMIAIVCSLNMKKMLKCNVLVRKLGGIETAGSINILFTDKTGTLTRGKLSATEIILGNADFKKTLSGASDIYKTAMANSLILNSSAYISGKKIIGGNLTEKALSKFACDLNLLSFCKNAEKTDSIEFSSENKFSAAKISGNGGGAYYKGAPELIISKCGKYLSENGEIKIFSSKKAVAALADGCAKKQNRTIALAYSPTGGISSSIPENLIFIGIIILKDDLRFNVKKSVSDVQRAGIQVVMITGDKKETAENIAKEAGIISSEKDIVLTSDELGRLSDGELEKILPDLRVVARALPSDKSRLVKISQSLGYVAAMTGDGLNDAPALKAADVGFAMGSGTEAAKEAGDLILTDDNFSSIKNAVLYGRTIFKSIKKFINYQLTINVAAVTVSVLGPLTGMYKPLNISQMLWVNLVMDTLAAMAFGGEAALKKYLLEKPIKRDEKIIDKKMWQSVLTGGLFISLASVFMFSSETIHSLFRPDSSDIYFYTGYFSFFIFSCIFNAFNARCEGIDLTENLAANKQFIVIFTLIFIIQIFMTRFGGKFLRTSALSFREWLCVISMAIVIIPVDLLRKTICRN